jgi:hypothetical protein
VTNRLPERKRSRLDAMVAVAAGTMAGVSRWAAALTLEDIPTAIADCCEFDPLSPDYAEL